MPWIVTFALFKAVGKGDSEKGHVRKWVCAPITSVTSACIVGSTDVQVLVPFLCHCSDCLVTSVPER